MQQPKRFQAESLGEAYAMVRDELGGDAIILSTRKASSPGLFGQPGRQFVEVIAHLPEGAVAPQPGYRPTLEQDLAAHDLVRGVAEAAAMGMSIDPAVDLAPRARARVEPTGVPTEMPDAMAESLNTLHEAVMAVPPTVSPVVTSASIEAPALAAATASMPSSGSSIADRALISTLARQLGEVRTMLDQLVADRVSDRVESGPPALKAVNELLTRQGLSQTIISPLLAQVSDALVRGTDRESALRTVERKLAARMPQVAQVDMGRRPAAILLVGPSGAGKTTMAIRLALGIGRTHGLRVTVAGTDVSRAGAPQQLIAYGAASGVDVRLCYAPVELKTILEDGSADVVIVDTPGHNGTRRDRMAELNAFTQVARRRSVLLTLPATMKGADLNDVVASYNGIGVDGLVLTRCDETSVFGSLVSVAIEASIGIAYTVHSDQVSDAARAGDNLALASAVVTGRWNVASSDRARPAGASAVLARVG